MGMIRGKCAGCLQMNELHEGVDGKGYCEDCLVTSKQDPLMAGRGSNLPPPIETSFQQERPVEQPDKRHELLDFIITHAKDTWIDKFLDDYKQQLKDSYGWVKLIEGTNNDRVLLRMARELGYGREAEDIRIMRSIPGREELTNGKWGDNGSKVGEPPPREPLYPGQEPPEPQGHSMKKKIKICEYKGCHKHAKVKGMCKTHYYKRIRENRKLEQRTSEPANA